MDQVIILEPQDDILQVHSKVEWSDGRRVILVVPRGCKALDSEHEIRLLRRWADSADLMISLVTRDIGVREMAADIGVPTFSTVERAQRANWNWRRNGNNVISRPGPLDDEEPRPQPPLLDRLGLAGMQLFITLALFAVAAAVLVVAALLLIPSARLVVTPASEVVSETREIILDPSVTTIDQVNAILPATAIRREISGTATIATTKVDTAPADHATGKVIFTNFAGTPATIPLGTIVETSSGVTVRFSTTVSATLPGGFNARAEVPVRALVPGPGGNVKPLQINFIEGPVSAVARVINLQAMSGGTIKQVHIVSFDDKNLLRQKLAEQLRRAAAAKMQNQLGEASYIPPASVQVLTLGESFDHLVDDAADTLTLQVQAVATGMAVDYSDLQKFAERDLLEKVPDGYEVLPGSLRVEADNNARIEGTSAILKLRSELYSTPRISVSELMQGITWKPRDEAAEIIAERVKLAKPLDMRLSPSWWPRLPFFGFRIAVFVEPEKTFNSPSQN